MEQTFNDLMRARGDSKTALFVCALWVFAETFVGIGRENMTIIVARHKNILSIALATALLLLVPLSAMQFTDEVAWTVGDFIVAGVLLFGASLTHELIARKAGNTVYRIAAGVAVATAFVLIWMNLAVGLIGSENNSANLMYIGVLAVGIIGAFIARFRPGGMALALFATALAQVSVSVIALIAGLGFTLLLNGFFAVLWVGSGLLFRQAALKHSVWS